MDASVTRATSAYLERLRRAGGRRSGKRDLIVDVFLEQEGHLSADDLFDLVRKRDAGIGRATVYRPLQWMVDAGVARKVDFGEGRFRFEHSFRHPRHFHLICKSCNRTFEFLSSDIELFIEEIAAERGFTSSQSVLQVYGTCEACRTGKTSAPGDGTTELVFARDALRVAIATERSGLAFYTRAASLTRDLRGRATFLKLAEEEREHLATLEERYRQLLAQDPLLESRPTFLFFKGAASGLFSAGTQELTEGVDTRKALMIGIRCERGSHRFFKRYGERFEDSEGKRMFLEFANEERDHLDLLIRESRALDDQPPRSGGHRRASTGAGRRPRGATP